MKSKAKRITGRPPKFKEARRPVTVTLPERTLRQLNLLDQDRARAIVKAVEAAVPLNDPGQAMVQTIEVFPGQALIVISPSRALTSIPWLRLVEIMPTRYLLSIPCGTAVEKLELAIVELLESLPPSDEYERTLLSTIRDKIGTVRKGQKLSTAEILFVATT